MSTSSFPTNTPPLLRVTDLRTEFPTRAGVVTALDGISLDVGIGESVAVVGESGAGKTTLAMSIMGLLTAPGRTTAGQILFRGADVLRLEGESLRRLRGAQVSLTVQGGALNPVGRIDHQLEETMRAHGQPRQQATSRVVPLLRAVGVPEAETRSRQYPHQLSGGTRQRVAVAMGIANDPELLIADEATSGLDATAQVQIVRLLGELRLRRRMALLLVTHNIGLVAQLCDRVIVMSSGRIVEDAPAEELFRRPQHPCTVKLLGSRLTLDRARTARRVTRPSTAADTVLALEDVSKDYSLADGSALRAVDGVSLSLGRGETLGLIGSTGCGKSTLARIAARLVPASSGRVRFDGVDITEYRGRQLHDTRRRLQIVLQDPLSALNPRMRASESIGEPLANFRLGPKPGRPERVGELMELVGFDGGLASRYPHQLSAGQRQRVAIARALASDPSLVILDEPTSCLDTASQADVLDLLEDLRERLGLAYLFISHDLGVISRVADRVAVMDGGRIVELGETEVVLARPDFARSRVVADRKCR